MCHILVRFFFGIKKLFSHKEVNTEEEKYPEPGGHPKLI